MGMVESYTLLPMLHDLPKPSIKRVKFNNSCDRVSELTCMADDHSSCIMLTNMRMMLVS